MSAVATMKITMLMTVIMKAVPRSRQAAGRGEHDSAISGRARRPSWLTTPYSAMPEVAGCIPMPQPRTTTQTTPMFHGPNGTLEPIPERIRYNALPRNTTCPG